MADDLGRDGWEQRWEQVLQSHAEQLRSRPAHPVLVEVAEALPAGRALDAGCGHGAESLWLAGHGWQVLGVDFSAAALGHAAQTAAEAGLADRVAWAEGDLGAWTPEPGAFDLVVCLYVHVAGSVVEMVRRLAGGVAPGGTLVLVGHRPTDPETGAPSPAAGQVQVSVEEAREALTEDAWEFVVAEERRRPVASSGVDAVVVARRRSGPDGDR